MSGLPKAGETITAEPVTDEAPAVDQTATVDNEQAQVEQPPARRRGRPRGSSNPAAPRKTQARKADDLKTLAKNIVGLHALAAMGTGLKELMIDEKEGEMLAGAMQAVADEYGLDFGGKTGAAVQLFGAAGMIYAPRIIRIVSRMKKEREETEGVPRETFPRAEN